MIEERLKYLMNKEWNIIIECKGKGREYQLTYEAIARKVVPSDATPQELLRSVYPIHVVADTLEELLDILERKILGQVKSK